MQRGLLSGEKGASVREKGCNSLRDYHDAYNVTLRYVIINFPIDEILTALFLFFLKLFLLTVDLLILLFSFCAR